MLERSSYLASPLKLFECREDFMDHRIERTMETINEQLHTGIMVRDLAARVGLSMSRLARLFRAELGVTPSAYLQSERMTRARLLVERTSLSIADIMLQVGVADPSHFARDFRRTHGFSPRTLRQQLRLAGRPARYLASESSG